MAPVQLFDLASQQVRWLSARQLAVAGNIANANTPGYTAVDVLPFEAVINDTKLTMTATNMQHIGADPAAPNAVPVKEASAWEVSHSGNSVSLEQELMKSGEVQSAASLNRAIVKAFNQMLMMSLRG